ncbi:MAG: hypothetical protein WKF58_03180 [Ilumatobacteraceae bacterium]
MDDTVSVPCGSTGTARRTTAMARLPSLRTGRSTSGTCRPIVRSNQPAGAGRSPSQPQTCSPRSRHVAWHTKAVVAVDGINGDRTEGV